MAHRGASWLMKRQPPYMPTHGPLAGLTIEPGWYTVYIFPNERYGQIVVNRRVQRWKSPGRQHCSSNVGSGSVAVESSGNSEDSFRMPFENVSREEADLVIHWDPLISAYQLHCLPPINDNNSHHLCSVNGHD